MTNIRNKMRSERNELANYIFIVFAILLTLVLGASVYRVVDIGWHPIIPLELLSLLAAYILAYFRKSIPFHIKAFLLIFTPYVIGIVGLMVFGIIGSNSFLWIFTPLIATILFNLRIGSILVIVSALMMIILGSFVSQGYWVFKFDPNAYVYSLSSWILQTVAYLCFAGTSVLIAGKMTKIIHGNLNLVEDQKKELENANNTKDKLFSVIAHDLRAPLQSLISLMEALVEEGVEFSEEEKIMMFRKMLKDSHSTSSMLENLLTWSRSQIGAIKIDKKNIDVESLIAESIAPYRGNAENKEIDIRINIEKELKLFTDEASIRIVISNLINNAIKFTPFGGEISVSGYVNQDKTIISVKDNGLGIKKENLELLFNETDHTSTLGTDDEKGTGLGLGLCFDLMKKNGGEICAESVDGEGSTFYISFV